MQVLHDSKVKFFSVVGIIPVLLLWICFWSFHSSKSYCLTFGKRKKKRREEEKRREKETKEKKRKEKAFS